MVTVDCVKPVAEFTATTCASGMVAPDVSPTEPVILPRFVCCERPHNPPKPRTSTMDEISYQAACFIGVHLHRIEIREVFDLNPTRDSIEH